MLPNYAGADNRVNADRDAEIVRNLHMPLPEGEAEREAGHEKRLDRPVIQGAFQCPKNERRRENRAEFVDMPGVEQRDDFAVQHQKQAAEKRAARRQPDFAQVKKHENAHQHEIDDRFPADRNMRRKDEQRQQRDWAEKQVKPAAERRSGVDIRQPRLKAGIAEEVFLDEDVPKILLRENVGRIDDFPRKKQLREKNDANQQQAADGVT